MEENRGERNALCEKANIKTTGSVHFHIIRKYTFSALHAIQQDIAKLIVGKQVDPSVLTYIQDIEAECERVFREAYKRLSLNGDITGKRYTEQGKQIETLKHAITQLENENVALKTRINLLQQRLAEHGDVLKLIPTMQKQIAYLKGRIGKQKPKKAETSERIT